MTGTYRHIRYYDDDPLDRRRWTHLFEYESDVEIVRQQIREYMLQQFDSLFTAMDKLLVFKLKDQCDYVDDNFQTWMINKYISIATLLGEEVDYNRINPLIEKLKNAPIYEDKKIVGICFYNMMMPPADVGDFDDIDDDYEI